MSVVTNVSENGVTFTISVDGDFSFSLLHEFQNAYKDNQAKEAKNIVIDMRKTTTVDSSALGMLLSMKEILKKGDGEISIINCNDFVGRILKVTNFEKKFSLD